MKDNKENIDKRVRDLEKNQDNIPVRYATPISTNAPRWAKITEHEESGKYKWDAYKYTNEGVGEDDTEISGEVAKGNYALESYESEAVLEGSIVLLHKDLFGFYVFDYSPGTLSGTSSGSIGSTGTVILDDMDEQEITAHNDYNESIGDGVGVKVCYNQMKARWDIIGADCE